jgi:SAM-dependent methyltransferase
MTSEDPIPEWEQLAQRDPQYFIDPTLGPGADPREFRELGRGIVDWAVGWAGELPAGWALEIGCGVGRDTIHLARHFEHVDAVDVSPTMIRLAREQGVPDNVSLHVVSGRDLEPLTDGAYVFAFSHLVFQHIESADDIAAYLGQIASKLSPRGVAVLHFDTRPSTALSRLARRLPDALLPRQHRRAIRRTRRPAEAVRRYGSQAGLVLEAERDADSANHWLRWRGPPS